MTDSLFSEGLVCICNLVYGRMILCFEGISSNLLFFIWGGIWKRIILDFKSELTKNYILLARFRRM